MVYRIALSDTAETDLEAAVAFLAQRSPEAAERIGMELVGVIFSLDLLPNRGSPVSARPGLRRLLHRDYLIYYRINEPARLVEVVRIWDGRKNPSSLSLP
jgi:plasmid stabilization system protein ParE